MLRVFADVILPVMAVAVLGGAIGRRIGLELETMSRAVFWLFSPCLVFMSIVDIRLAGDQVARIVLVGVAVFVVNVAVAQLWARARSDDERTIAGASLAGSVANQGNLGLPISRLAFGSAGLDVAVVCFVAGVVLWSSAGIAVASLGRSTMRRALVAPFRYPAVYAAAAATIINVADLHLPVVFRESLGSLAGASIPCMLVVLGLQLHRPARGDLLEPAMASVNRLLIGPLVAWPAATVLGLHGAPWRTVIVVAGMPTAVMVTVVARELDARPELCVRAVVVSTALCVATLTVLISLVR